MFCHKCGYRLPDEGGFCPMCGEKVVYSKPPFLEADVPHTREVSKPKEDSNRENFKSFVNRHVQSTTQYRSVEELLNSNVSANLLWASLLGPAVVLGLLSLVISGRLGTALVLALLGLLIGFFTAYVVGWNERRKLSNKFSNTFTGPIDTDDLLVFLSNNLSALSPIFHEWSYITQVGYGIYGAVSAGITNTVQKSLNEVSLGTELGEKRHFFAELYIGPDLLNRASGKMRYTPDVEHRISGIMSLKKYTLLVQIAPILQAAMEYYLTQEGGS